ncbi:S1 family peptidase [Veronia pacifica]
MSPRVINGDNARLSDAPWQGALFVNGSFSCGAVSVAPNWFLTAAHCLHKVSGALYEPNAIQVVSGTTYIPPNLYEVTDGEISEVNQIFINPAYRADQVSNDIALLYLSSASGAKNIKIADNRVQMTLDNRVADSEDDSLQLTGWGSVLPSRSGYSPYLQKVNLSLVSDQVCATSWGLTMTSVANYSSIFICAESLRTGSCSGDSGGPLVWFDPDRLFDTDRGATLVGIVSYKAANPCGSGVAPDVYTQTSSYLNWVSQCMQSVNSCPRQEKAALSANDENSLSDEKSGGSYCFAMILLFLFRYGRGDDAKIRHVL